MNVAELQTPPWWSMRTVLEHNLATMAAALPGRPAAPARQGAQVHRAGARARPRAATAASPAPPSARSRAWPRPGSATTCCSPTRSLDARRLRRAGRLRRASPSRSTREATIDAAAAGGVREVLIDVNVGLPRCGCAPDDAGRLADLARARGLDGARRHGLRGPRRRARRTAPSATAADRRGDGAAARRPTRRRRRRRLRRRHRHLRPATPGRPRSRPAPTR